MPSSVYMGGANAWYLKTKARVYLQCTLRAVDHQLEDLSSSSFWPSHVYMPLPGLSFLIYKLLELNQMARRSFLALSIYFSHTNTCRHFLCITHDTSVNGASMCNGCWRAFNQLLYSPKRTHTNTGYLYTQVKHMRLVLILL